MLKEIKKYQEEEIKNTEEETINASQSLFSSMNFDLNDNASQSANLDGELELLRQNALKEGENADRIDPGTLSAVGGGGRL